MKVFGSTPHPRALIWGFSDDQVARIAPAFATARAINDLTEVEQAEWDVLVTRNGCFGSAPHLYVLGIEGDPDGSPKTFDFVEGNPVQGVVQFGGISRATQFRVGAGLNAELDKVVTTSLIPAA
jgi:hypothetical protein